MMNVGMLEGCGAWRGLLCGFNKCPRFALTVCALSYAVLQRIPASRLASSGARSLSEVAFTRRERSRKMIFPSFSSSVDNLP